MTKSSKGNWVLIDLRVFTKQRIATKVGVLDSLFSIVGSSVYPVRLNLFKSADLNAKKEPFRAYLHTVLENIHQL